MRTHTCGELRKEHEGQTATLCGWVDSVRIQGKVGFVDIRDRYGMTQVFISPKLLEKVEKLSKESVIKITGEVKVRPQANPNIETGAVEVSAKDVEVLSIAEPLPMQLNEEIDSTEETRLRYRYLDLRRPEMQKNIILRSKLIKSFRDFLDADGFIEVETPLLAKSTPEGARDYLVPSRVFKGNFYALPQSPQLFKQLLMVSGFDKYYQFARCLRDEDLRADRQPEFTQLDLEMSFVEPDDVLQVMENAVKHVWKEVLGVDIKNAFPRMTYKEVMEKYNSDKPDLRKNKDDPNEFAFLWVTDFPMFEWDEEEKRPVAMHHPFTHPVDEDLPLLEKEPLKVRAKAYDLVCNGWEIGGGSIRISNHELQKRVLEALKLDHDTIHKKFAFLIDAFSYGAPPHGGLAFGFDRLAAIAAGEKSIKEVIPFPKNKEGKDLMLDAPAGVSQQQLDDAGIALKK